MIFACYETPKREGAFTSGGIFRILISPITISIISVSDRITVIIRYFNIVGIIVFHLKMRIRHDFIFLAVRTAEIGIFCQRYRDILALADAHELVSSVYPDGIIVLHRTKENIAASKSDPSAIFSVRIQVKFDYD